MKGLLFDGLGFKDLITSQDALDDWYNAIGCSCIDIVSRKVRNKRLEVVCDDEGLFVNHPIATALNTNGEVMLVGSLVFYGGVDSEGNLTDITDDDVKTIKDSVVTYLDRDLGFMKAIILDY